MKNFKSMLFLGFMLASSAQASSDCIDLSGDYYVEEESCVILSATPGSEKQVSPAIILINSGETSLVSDTRLKLRQEGCENLKISRQASKGEDYYFDFDLSLKPLNERTEITWNAQGLTYTDNWIKYTSCAADWWNYIVASPCSEFDRFNTWELSRVGNELVVTHTESVEKYRFLRGKKKLYSSKTQCRLKKLQ